MFFAEAQVTGFSRWVIDQIIQDIPEDCAVCEFDCRKTQCTQDQWMLCSRRLDALRASEQVKAI